MSYELQELMAEMNDLKDVKKILTSWVKEEANGGKECFDTKSVGETVDMIKDLAEASKECYEALYYKTVIEAMSRGEEPEYGEEQVRGYNHRHLGNGEFARAGRGHMVRGYRPYMDQEPYIDAYMHDPNFQERMRNHNGSMGYDGDPERSRHGEVFDNYRRARRNFHDSKSMEDKEEMDNHHMIYMQDTLRNLKTMWDNADPMLRKKVKEDFGEDIIKVFDKM